MQSLKIELFTFDQTERCYISRGVVARANGYGQARKRAEAIMGQSFETTSQHTPNRSWCEVYRGKGCAYDAKHSGRRVVTVSQPIEYVPSCGQRGFW